VLYRPEAFEPLTERGWDEAWARAAIRALVDRADEAFDPDRLWPAHEWDGWMSRPPLKGLYVGAAGVLWALAALRRRGLAETRIDVAGTAERVAVGWTEDDLPGFERSPRAAASLFSGHTGTLLVACLLGADLADLLHERIVESADGEAYDLMWGTPGTMRAAAAMHEATGEPRWLDAWRQNAQALLDARDDEGLWTQHLTGETYRGLAPPHGLAGNARILLDGPLDEDAKQRLRRQTNELLSRYAVLEEGRANWPGTARDELPGEDGEIRLQWCTGAPGVVACAWDYLDEELLLAGGELVWEAGPHGAEKGACICHGTAGNGYALLKAFARTGDERWLERARCFAVHALEQAAAGPGRFSLWTGDLGVALFAADCISATAAYPVIDTL
jgi:Lanthionine synthetase C-like protein